MGLEMRAGSLVIVWLKFETGRCSLSLAAHAQYQAERQGHFQLRFQGSHGRGQSKKMSYQT